MSAAAERGRVSPRAATVLRRALRVRASESRTVLEALEDRRLLANGVGLRAHYFNNDNFTAPVPSKIDAQVNFNWGTGAPVSGVGAETFSVRFSGLVEADYTETYRFYVNSDQGVRLWVNGQKLIDDWSSLTAGERSAPIALVAGRRYELLLEMRDTNGPASVALSWSSATRAKQIIPTSALLPSERGSLLREKFNGPGSLDLSSHAGYPNNPASAGFITSFESTSQGDLYGQRLGGYVHAPQTGAYTFHIAGDDRAELYLSNSADAAGARLIASVPSATALREWNRHAEQRSVQIRLVAGQKYYVEVRHGETTGADHVSVGWTLPDGRFEGPIAGHDLSPLTPTVKLYAARPEAFENEGPAAQYTVTRSGGPLSVPLSVGYSIGGTASNGVDYTLLSGTVTIPAGSASATIEMRPINDGWLEANRETLVLTLKEGTGYELGNRSTRSVTGTLVDDERTASGTQMLPTSALAAFAVSGTQYGTKALVPITGMPFTQALQINTTIKPPFSYSIQAFQQIPAAMTQGDVLLLTFWARSTSDNPATVQAIVERAVSPFSKSLTYSATVRSEWRKYQMPFVAGGTYAANGAQLGFQVGYDPQGIQIAGVTLQNFTNTLTLGQLPRTWPDYRGRNGDADWRDDAQERIATERKGTLAVEVRDEFGSPVEGAQVFLRQRRHDYAFGSALRGSNLINNSTADGDKYRALAKRLFNRGTVENELKWESWASNRQRGIDSANWVIDAGMSLRGHTLVWPRWVHVPSSIKTQYDALYTAQGAAAAAEYLRQTVLDHITDEAGAIAGQPLIWDVVNEPYANHELMDILGDSAVIDWFGAAQQADSNAQLHVNDYGIFSNNATDKAHQDNFAQWIEYLLNSGAPLAGIGEQSHVGGRMTDFDRLQTVVDRFAAYGLPIEITELDIDTPDEQLQADYLRDYLTFMFSQPSVEGITMWGFWAGSHYAPNAALYRQDFSIKPSGQAYEDLVFGDWWTDTGGTTLADGTYSAGGFAGDYEVVVVTPDGQTSVSSAALEAGGNISVDVTVGAINPRGGAGNDTFFMRLDSSRTKIEIYQNSAALGTPTFARPVTSTSPIEILAGAGNDTFTIDLANGNPLGFASVTFDGELGADVMKLVNTTASSRTYDLYNGQLLIDGAAVDLSSIDGFQFEGGAGNDTLNVHDALPFTPAFSGGSGSDQVNIHAGNYTFGANLSGLDLGLALLGDAQVTLSASRQLDELELGDNSRLSLLSGDKVIRVRSLEVSGAATLDLGDGAMAIEPTGLIGATALLPEVTGWVTNARGDGSWTGSGVTSTAASNSNLLTGLAVVLNDRGDGLPLLGTFMGQSVGTNAVLVKYTYHGDANLDGKVSIADFVRIDRGFARGSTGWQNGDLSLDGVVDASDYALIDNAFMGQSSPLSSALMPLTSALMSAKLADSAFSVKPITESDILGIGGASVLA